ncbi:hypothetical protein COCSUDRAFT_45356 [Coccomyxa subellipsoidea C-169]|uniref:Glycosyl transferase CAP10 domain-containing protein n=1 Tax=Coccomyxa subellipsoidea (strain C-169) TaxID=574566 RepID=I0YJL1_COCSC|nr:hypothetical protein COCSUDRAFT_45356 [Coccomyxa subellipsoidea C-169]EIE18580.1 hypothetical protein COCSUDRAFT_45356 [Coccomyxa subellipsoidea C-169]|eukprot:XP_005643124.1 hypothetical protein COCSUDRAFT_45356 [Coccomyxa subellipsoidea C-169]
MAPLGPPNSQMIRYAKLDSWALLVVELEGMPQNWRPAFDSLWEASAGAASQAPPNLVLLDRTTQQQLGFASGGCSDSKARSKNIGSLFAIMCGADVIIEAEEGVEHVEAAGQLPLQAAASGPFLQAFGDPSSRLINPYALFGHPEIWPAVFPPAAVSNATFEFRKVQQPPDQDGSYRPLIQSALVNDYPATDAVLGLTLLAHKGPQRFYSKPAAIGVQPGYFAPLGLGSTVYGSDAFWGLVMQGASNQALAPAWRSLWVQKLLWGVGGQLLILAPSARQNRTVRLLQLEAQGQEMEGYSKTGTLVDFLHHWEGNENILDLKMLQLARDLRSAGFWSQAEVDSMGAWVADLRAVGYVFPDVLVPKQQAVSPAEGARTKKLAAFCFTGQADRAPEAIPATLSQMQKLLTAESTSQEAMQLAETLEHSRTEDGSILFAHDTFAYVSTHESCGDHIRWIAQQPFTFSILYNDPLLEVPYPLDPARQPPPGFQEWLGFAKEKGCVLEKYDRIEEDLRPFRKTGITAAMVREAAQLEHVALFQIRGGQVISGLAGALPDMDFVVNCIDEPRVLLGEGTAAERMHTSCRGASQDTVQLWHQHGYFVGGWQPLVGSLLPVLSQSKINGCFQDITIPTWMNDGTNRVEPDEILGWRKRCPKLYFRGTSTGGRVDNTTAFHVMHRQRLVEYGLNRTEVMDVGFVGYVQCSEEACRAMEAQYGLKERVPEDEMWRYKFLMILDGNTFSSRLMRTLTSGSLVFRAGLFSEWFDERIQPGVHYIPVGLDFQDLQGKLDWALSHDKEAHAIAEQAALQAKLFIRPEDIQCYWYRLLLEYAGLLQQGSASNK